MSTDHRGSRTSFIYILWSMGIPNIEKYQYRVRIRTMYVYGTLNLYIELYLFLLSYLLQLVQQKV